MLQEEDGVVFFWARFGTMGIWSELWRLSGAEKEIMITSGDVATRLGNPHTQVFGLRATLPYFQFYYLSHDKSNKVVQNFVLPQKLNNPTY